MRKWIMNRIVTNIMTDPLYLFYTMFVHAYYLIVSLNI